MIHMKTVTVRDLRTRFPQVEALLSEGESVAITKHKRVVAILRAPARHKADKLDFRKHLKEHPLSCTTFALWSIPIRVKSRACSH